MISTVLTNTNMSRRQARSRNNIIAAGTSISFSVLSSNLQEAESCSFQGDQCVCPTGNLEACQWLLALLFLDRDRARLESRLRSQKWAAGYRTSFPLVMS